MYTTSEYQNGNMAVWQSLTYWSFEVLQQTILHEPQKAFLALTVKINRKLLVCRQLVLIGCVFSFHSQGLF